MTVARRTLLTGLAALPALAACGGDAAGEGGRPRLAFWYWPGALSDAAVRDVATAFAGWAAVVPQVVDGDFRQRLLTALASRTDAPDVSGVKGEDMPGLLERTGTFLDLNELGARDVASRFAAAKIAEATTADGRQVGLPIDLGPTALFYRADLWNRAGLPRDPAATGRLTRTWDGWFEAARRLRDRLPGTFAIRNSGDVFTLALAQQPETFVTRAGRFAGDGGGVRAAWDLAVRSVREGVQAGIYDTDAFNAALARGTITGHLGAAWMALDIASGAPGTAGAWRVADGPGGPANIGGSFLTLPVTCREPRPAFEFLVRLLAPENLARSFTDAAVFPAATAAYRLPALTRGQDFFGGQATIEVFGPIAEHLPATYVAPADASVAALYSTELANVEGGKDPARAWQDAVAAGAAAVAAG